MFNYIKFKSFIHSSSIIKSDHPNPIYDSINPQPTIFDPLRISATSSLDLSNIELVEIKENLSYMWWNINKNLKKRIIL